MTVMTRMTINPAHPRTAGIPRKHRQHRHHRHRRRLGVTSMGFVLPPGNPSPVRGAPRTPVRRWPCENKKRRPQCAGEPRRETTNPNSGRPVWADPVGISAPAGAGVYAPVPSAPGVFQLPDLDGQPDRSAGPVGPASGGTVPPAVGKVFWTASCGRRMPLATTKIWPVRDSLAPGGGLRRQPGQEPSTAALPRRCITRRTMPRPLYRKRPSW